MRCTAIRQFDVEQGSTEGMWYRIVVKYRNVVVDDFLFPTMKEAQRAFENAGYQAVQALH